MGDEIKECPCCGSRDVLFMDDWYEDGMEHMVVICNNCHLMTQIKERPTDDDGNTLPSDHAAYYELKESIIKSWNRRENASARSEDVLSLAEHVLHESKTFCNANVPEKFVKGISDLSEKIDELKKQIARERVKLPENNTEGEVEQNPNARQHVEPEAESAAPAPTGHRRVTVRRPRIRESDLIQDVGVPVMPNYGPDVVVESPGRIPEVGESPEIGDPPNLEERYVGHSEGRPISYGHTEQTIVSRDDVATAPRTYGTFVSSTTGIGTVGSSAAEGFRTPSSDAAIEELRPSSRHMGEDAILRQMAQEVAQVAQTGGYTIVPGETAETRPTEDEVDPPRAN